MSQGMNVPDSKKRSAASNCTRYAIVIFIPVSIIIVTAILFKSQTFYEKYMPISVLSRNKSPSSSESQINKTEGRVEMTLKQRDVQNSRSNISNDDVEMLSRYSTIFKESRVNCAAIIQGNKIEIERGIQKAKETKNQLLSDEYYINIAKNCEDFKRTRGYITSVLSKQEEEFPLAYSILAYKDIEMVESLLRQIYRPQNFYCLHIDGKANARTFQAASAISKCFPNVFMASIRIRVIWGKFSVLQPELICMKDLYSKGKWKYFINLTGQEMPLKTNLELVKILTAYQGANDIKGSFMRVSPIRLKHGTLDPPPDNIHPLKGSVHIVANRAFIDYMLHNKTAMRLLEWVKHTDIPDETYFSTLNHNPHLGIPGTYLGWPESDSSNRKPFLARYKNWKGAYPCSGYYTRGICILSTGDLPLLANRPELFANKFHIDTDSVVIGCLEENLFNSTRDEYLGLKKFNTTLYEGLGFVINQVGRKITRKFIEIPNVV